MFVYYNIYLSDVRTYIIARHIIYIYIYIYNIENKRINNSRIYLHTWVVFRIFLNYVF